MNARTLFVGIDWGTHSSKWWYSVEVEEQQQGVMMQPRSLARVVDSTIRRKGDSLLIHRERAQTECDVQDSRLKRLLLADPMGADFWKAVREGIRVSSGEAAVLVISCMLSDVYASLANENIQLSQSTQIELRYSLPNWTQDDDEHNAARKRMFQTTLVATALLKQKGWDALPRIGEACDIEKWRDVIREIRESEEIKPLKRSSPKTFAELVGREYVLGHLKWRLAAESSAAGFTSLSHMLKDIPSNSDAQKHWVKLLVVDVGAGSTDSGYFISSRERLTERIVFNYLPPAITLNYAGESLTEMIRDHFQRQRRVITQAEAEIMKLNAPEEWIREAFVEEWIRKIAANVAQYIRLVPDELRLMDELLPPLKILLTGGSGLVQGLDSAIKKHVIEALMQRGMSHVAAGRIDIASLNSEIPDKVDAARRAVSTGAAQSKFARLVYIPVFEKAIPYSRIQSNSWSGR